MSTSLNIAFFNKELPSDKPNGVSVQVHRLANALSARGHRLTCFTFSPPPPDALYSVVQLNHRNRGRLGVKFEPARCFASVDTTGFDILHYHGDDYLCRGDRRRVRTFYGSALHEAWYARTVRRRLYQGLFYLFELRSCSLQGRFAAISAITCKALPVEAKIIPCGIPESFSVGGQKSEAPTILFVGDFGSRKRGDLAIKAFADTVQPQLPDCTLRVVGPQAAPLLPGVISLGPISTHELVDEYRKAWVYCCASSYEGFGVPVAEAQACGTAVVATTNPGALEQIVDTKTGLLCQPDSLGDHLLLALTDSNLRKRLQQQSAQESKRYAITTVAAQYEQLYYSCMDTHSNQDS